MLVKLWVDPITGKKYMDKLEDFDYDKHKDFETRQPCGDEEAENITLNTNRKRNASKEYVQMNRTQMIEMRKSGKTIRLIAQYFGISDTVVRNIVKDVCPPIRATRDMIVSKDNQYIELYKSGLTMKEVSAKTGTAYHSVNARLHELEELGLVEVRTTHESRKMKMGATV